MSLLRIDSSIQGDQSASSALADLVLDEFAAARPEVGVVRRHLGQDPLPADAWQLAVMGGFTPEDDRSQAQRDALELAGRLADEMQSATGAVLALPLYNFGVSQHVKTWIDLSLAGAAPGTRLLEGKPVVLVTTRVAPTAPARLARAGTTTPTTSTASSSTSGVPTSPWLSASSPSSVSTPRSTSSPRWPR